MLTPAGSAPTVIRLHPNDDVIIATRQLMPGTRIDAEQLVVTGLVPPGHKVATRDIAKGEAVKRYNQIIGVAREAITRGQHVHVHNLGMSEFARDHAYGVDTHPTDYVDEPAHFMGIRRDDGRVATRNYIGILTSVNCSATVARAIADHFRRDVRPEALADFPNVDGVVALTHGLGCGIDMQGEGIAVLRRTLAGYAVHPNFASVLFVGLGCETNQIDGVLDAAGPAGRTAKLRSFTIQDSGGTRKTIERGIAMVKELLADANRVQRVPVPASHLCVGLQCGGSDGYSGISANPALGAAVDRLVRHGGTAILSETPEIYGAEHLLTRRAASQAVGDKLLARIRWWQDYCTRNGGGARQQPIGRQQGGRLDDDPRKIAWRGCEGRHDEPRRSVRIRAADRCKRLRVHGLARLRPGVGDRSGRLGCQSDLLHDWTRLRLRLRAVAVAETRDQHRAVGTSGGRYRPQLRRRCRWYGEHR